MLGVSVAQAIVRREGRARLTTSSQRLDDAFLGHGGSVGKKGGIARGTVGEIVGPPGIGKTTLALQIAVNVVKEGESVIWIDTSSIIPLTRLRSILAAGAAVTESAVTECSSRIHCLSIRSLPSLLALLLHSAHTETSIFAKAANLSLVVIDDLSTPILATYPAGFEDDFSRQKQNRKEYANTDSASVKRTNVLRELASKLASLAAKRNVAILVLNQLTTKVVVGNSASLVPALGDVWTSVCSYRVTLYRHRVLPDYCDQAEDVRFAYFQKCEGIIVKKEDAQHVPFTITDNGIEDVHLKDDRKHILHPDEVDTESRPKRRRVLSFAEEYVDDSEGEDGDLFSAVLEDAVAETEA